MQKKKLYVNGIERSVVTEGSDLLADVIRKSLRLTGTKVGCGKGQCGACNVIMDGKLIRSCITKMERVPDGAAITTIEGIGTPQDLHALQMAWMIHGGAQCGFCTPGFIVSAKALIDSNPDPSRDDIRDWFQKYKNACRCTGYQMLVDAVQDAVRVLKGEISMQDLAFKLPENGKVLGTSMPRPSAAAKVTAPGTSVRMPDCSCRRTLCSSPWFRPRSPMPTSSPSTPARRSGCPAWSRWSPTRTSRARTASPV